MKKEQAEVSQGSYQSVKICKRIHHLHHHHRSLAHMCMQTLLPIKGIKWNVRKGILAPFIVIFRFFFACFFFIWKVLAIMQIKYLR